MDAFVEFECRFAQLSKRDQGLVGANKVHMFVRSIDRNERKAIGIQLEDDNAVNGLTNNWDEVERVCRRHDKRKMGFLSTKSWSTRDDRSRIRCGNTPPPKEESLKMEPSTELNIEVLMREALENLKAQVEAEKKIKMESKPRRMVIEEEQTSLQMHVNEVANTKAQVRYDDIEREGIEPFTFLSYEEMTVKDKSVVFICLDVLIWGLSYRNI